MRAVPAGPGTDDADWLVGRDEATAEDDAAAVAAASSRAAPDSAGGARRARARRCGPTGPGTEDADWLVGRDEATAEDDAAAVSAASSRAAPGRALVA